MAACVPLGVLLVFLLPLTTNARELASDQQQFAFLAVGDYGGVGDGQYHVAAQMDVYKAKVGADLVVGVGDNFYFHGVSSIYDSQWYWKWYKVYKERSVNMKDVPWHAVLGNHDYCGNAKAQIEYNRNGWRMDDFFWVHKFRAGKQSFAFVYIDTNLLAYNVDTPAWADRDCPNMERQFRQFSSDPKNRWSQEEHLRIVREKLDYCQDSDWILVFGHHPVGGGQCGGDGRLSELMSLFETRRVSAYIYGHIHALGYGNLKGISYVMTGAGCDRAGASCKSGGAGAIWHEDSVGGFMYAKMFENRMQITYVDDTGKELYSTSQRRR